MWLTMCWFVAGVARADAPSVPVLGASEGRFRLDTSLGVLAGATRDTPMFVQTVEYETNLADDAFRLGVRYAVAGARSLDTSRSRQGSLVPSNIALTLRAQTVTLHGLSFAAGAQFTAPSAWVSVGGVADDASLAIRSVRLDRRVDFTARVASVSPHVDVRVVQGRWTVQVRQTLDASLQLSSTAPQSTTATSMLYVGARFGQLVPGVELFHLYLLDGGAADAGRSRVTVMPHLAWSMRNIEPMIGLLYGSPTYHPAGDRVFGLRLGFSAKL
jgi:hypothetical protein